ncbi:MCE family protein [Amycolatopsis acidiphila]|uniref:MCE family protein n=1 Tax=Amycolatopsis acidiphila TaxID=715473 RepID=A0A558AL31_9PSEU|nr:MCE family protein [Amycolatopsis acidiphila]TVT24979.1 MCE family protein [Amycolatopsis acidiphila]UIJ57515.1 MCE family protein [Amycolatopsis acidiphila]GHG96525.1 ABC transporter substrate-binding protein [Amycolatopsis acidiphila]
MKSLAGPVTKLSLFVVFTVLSTLLLAMTIANITFQPSTGYHAVFSDVTSLNVGDDIRVSGVRVGQVDAIEIAGDNENAARVDFSVDAGRTLPRSITAVVKYRNLVGQRYISLVPQPGEPGGDLRPGDTIPLRQTKPALNLTQLFNGFKPLFQALSPDDVNKLSYELIQVLQGEGGTVSSLLRHTTELATAIAGKDEAIGQVIDNLNRVLDTVNGRGDELSGLVGTLQELVSGLAEDRKPIGDSIGALADLSATTTGFLDDAREPLKQDIAGLGVLAGNLNRDSGLVEQFLNNLPDTVRTITPTASYGSWFNFYLCDASGNVGISSLGVNVPVIPVPLAQTPPRCTS